MSQVDRVLALLRARGPEGLGTTEMQELPIADGGAPVLRLAARVQQLRDRGYAIRSERQSNGCARYVLESGPAGSQGDPRPSGEVRATAVSATVDPCEGMAKPAAGDASDSQHGLPAEPVGLFDPAALEQRDQAWKDVA